MYLDVSDLQSYERVNVFIVAVCCLDNLPYFFSSLVYGVRGFTGNGSNKVYRHTREELTCESVIFLTWQADFLSLMLHDIVVTFVDHLFQIQISLTATIELANKVMDTCIYSLPASFVVLVSYVPDTINVFNLLETSFKNPVHTPYVFFMVNFL